MLTTGTFFVGADKIANDNDIVVDVLDVGDSEEYSDEYDEDEYEEEEEVPDGAADAEEDKNKTMGSSKEANMQLARGVTEDVVVSVVQPPSPVRYFPAYYTTKHGGQYLIHHSAWKFIIRGISSIACIVVALS